MGNPRISTDELAKVIDSHRKWLSFDGGYRANLSDANLSGADLSGADLRGANLSGADLRGANLSRANLSGADLRHANLSDANLRDANLSGADLRGANLSGADLSRANLSGADLSRANLSGADLSDANLSHANLSGADGLLDASNYLSLHFEATADGIIAYKTFGSQYPPPETWRIEPGSVITEVCNPDRGTTCGCGINVAPLDWVRSENSRDATIWRCLIRWIDLAGVIVPFETDGKIRCSRLQLIEQIETSEVQRD